MPTCGSPSLPAMCTPDTLLYVGADVDVHMLKFMQPWETQAIYFDGMKLNYGSEDEADVTRYYRFDHRSDTRSAWQKTSASLRPCPELQCASPLTELLVERMKQENGFSHVRAHANLSIEFALRSAPNLTRSLTYVIAEDGHSLLESLRGRVSTVAMVGAAGVGIGQLGDVLGSVFPACLRNATLVATKGEGLKIAELAPIVSRHERHYPLSDTLAGRRFLQPTEPMFLQSYISHFKSDPDDPGGGDETGASPAVNGDDNPAVNGDEDIGRDRLDPTATVTVYCVELDYIKSPER